MNLCFVSGSVDVEVVKQIEYEGGREIDGWSKESGRNRSQTRGLPYRMVRETTSDSQCSSPILLSSGGCRYMSVRRFVKRKVGG
jgi:hypothetical protein